MCMAERIKKRRIEMGYTQEELATKLGLQKSAVAKYENGRVENIKRSVISKMAEILDCPPSYLMGWSDNSHGSEKYMVFEEDQDSIYIPKDASGEYSEHERELLKIFTALNEGNREKVITFSKNLYSIQCLNKEQEILLNAANAIPDAAPEDIQRDDDIMNDENF